jgi:tripartite-type tricarboxylate transporter receptor subunit TctC
MISKRSLATSLAAGLVAAAALFSQAPAHAQAWPTKPVRYVVPFPPAGATDAIARMLATEFSKAWGQSVVVDNRAGATGAVGLDAVAKSAPDGYTILMGTATTHAVSPAVTAKLPYDTLRDFAPATLVATFPNMLVVHPSVPAKTVPELIAYLKANSGKLTFASSGTGGSVHLAGELFKIMTGTSMLHVPYKGSGPALNDLLAGHVNLAFDNMVTVFPHVQAGRLRALGVAGLERSPSAPDVPAIAETVAGFEANSWVGTFAPANTPMEIVRRISADFARIAQGNEFRQRLVALGAVAAPTTPEAFGEFVRKDNERWRQVVKAANIKVE